jgi:hypothetical protein
VGCLVCNVCMYVGCLVCNMYVYAGYSLAGRVHIPKNSFLRGSLSSIFGKICKWKGQCHVFIGREFLDYNNRANFGQSGECQ